MKKKSLLQKQVCYSQIYKLRFSSGEIFTAVVIDADGVLFD